MTAVRNASFLVSFPNITDTCLSVALSTIPLAVEHKLRKLGEKPKKKKPSKKKK